MSAAVPIQGPAPREHVPEVVQLKALLTWLGIFILR